MIATLAALTTLTDLLCQGPVYIELPSYPEDEFLFP